MRYVSIILAVLVLLSTIPVAAQPSLPAQMFEVPVDGYSSTDTYVNTDIWNEYRIQVPRNHELEYEFQVTGQGNLSIYLIPYIGAEYLLQGSYYISYSSAEPVSSFSRVFPADFGFDYEYTIAINSTTNVTYTASISINEIDTPDYTLYYVLMILGLVGIVVLSWLLVKRQMKDEKQTKLAAREERKNRHGKRRR